MRHMRVQKVCVCGSETFNFLFGKRIRVINFEHLNEHTAWLCARECVCLRVCECACVWLFYWYLYLRKWPLLSCAHKSPKACVEWQLMQNSQGNSCRSIRRPSVDVFILLLALLPQLLLSPISNLQ